MTDGAFAPTGQPTPQVGIFWLVPAPGAPVLLCDSTPWPQAEPYGVCLGHPRGHFETWEAWRALGMRCLGRLGLPACILGYEYEDFPRGRIVYQRDSEEFIIYADPRLHRPRLRRAILARFALEPVPVRFAVDAHYRRR